MPSVIFGYPKKMLIKTIALAWILRENHWSFTR